MSEEKKVFTEDEVRLYFEKAKRQIAIDELYGEWIELYQNQRQGMHR